MAQGDLPVGFQLKRPAGRESIEQALPLLVRNLPVDYFSTQRWFGGKGRTISEIELVDQVTISDDVLVLLALLQVVYAGGEADLYQLPLLFWDVAADPPPVDESAKLLLVIESPGTDLFVYDAFSYPDYGRMLFQLLASNAHGPTKRGNIAFQVSGVPANWRPEHPHVLGVEQSNTSIVFDDRWILKSYRRILAGEARDLEIGRFLATKTSFRFVPQIAGSIQYTLEPQNYTLGVLQNFVKNVGDGWSFMLNRLENVLSEMTEGPPGNSAELSASGKRQVHDLLGEMEALGRITGELHKALGSRKDIPDFAPEPVTGNDVQSWCEDLLRQAERAFNTIRSRGETFPENVRHALYQFLANESVVEGRARELGDQVASDGLKKIQIHGDYHLGQVLKTGDDFMVIDFEGEPLRPPAERRAKQSPVKDAAGMLRSFDYLVLASLKEIGGEEKSHLYEWLLDCRRLLAASFVKGWADVLEPTGLLPASRSLLNRLLSFFELSKAFYELNYELNHRPDWVLIPLGGIDRLLANS